MSNQPPNSNNQPPEAEAQPATASPPPAEKPAVPAPASPPAALPAPPVPPSLPTGTPPSPEAAKPSPEALPTSDKNAEKPAQPPPPEPAPAPRPAAEVKPAVAPTIPPSAPDLPATNEMKAIPLPEALIKTEKFPPREKGPEKPPSDAEKLLSTSEEAKSETLIVKGGPPKSELTDLTAAAEAFKLAGKPRQTGLLDPKTLENLAQGETFDPGAADIFPLGGRLRLEIGEQAIPLILPISGPVTFGRRDPSVPIQPEIDLVPYAGYRMGVSRLHARILRHTDGYLQLLDLGSSNGTYVNGQRLSPRQGMRLRDGDEVQFGQLKIKLHFD